VYPSAVTAGKLVPLRWGVDYNDDVFMGLQLEHKPGLYLQGSTQRATATVSDSLAIDAYTATAENHVFQFRSTRSVAEFRNLIYLIVGEGLDAAAKVLIDGTSFTDSAARRFIGDLWMHLEQVPDGTSLQGLSTSLWDELVRWHWTCSITMDDRPGLYPDDEVYLTGFEDTEIPDGSIYKVLQKDWQINEAGRYTHTVTCEMVEEGPG
jgi:hypothetical protein